jgi:hypothetical protein
MSKINPKVCIKCAFFDFNMNGDVWCNNLLKIGFEDDTDLKECIEFIQNDINNETT